MFAWGSRFDQAITDGRSPAHTFIINTGTNITVTDDVTSTVLKSLSSAFNVTDVS